MVLVGISWLVFWLLVEVFQVTVLHAALGVAVLFILIGIVVGERPWVRRP